MKIYTLTIAYNDKTEEIDYIQEHVEEDHPGALVEWDIELGSDEADFNWDHESLLALIAEHGLGEA